MPAHAPAARRLGTLSLPSWSAQLRLSSSYEPSWMELYGITRRICDARYGQDIGGLWRAGVVTEQLCRRSLF